MKFTIFILTVLLLTVQSFAQSPTKILKQAEKAIGGAKAVLAIRSVERTGRIKRVSDGAAGEYAFRTSRANRMNAAFDLDGFEYETGYNGRSGWTRNSRDGLQTLTGSASLALQAESVFRNDLWFNAKKDKSKIISSGTAAVNSKTANVVSLITAKGVTIRIYIDAATGLIVKDEIMTADTSSSAEYGDYRDVAGTKQPHFIELKTADGEYEVTVDNITVNRQIEPSEFDFPQNSGEPLPDIQALLQDLRANEDRVEEMLDSYSFVQKSTKRELGKDGILRESGSETYQLSFYKGNRIRRLIEKNGRPLSAREQADEDKEAGKRVEEIERKIAKQDARMGTQGADGAPSEESRRISTAEVLRASKLSNPRRERFRGRDVIVFDFEPDPTFDFKNAKSMLKFFGKTAGVIWVDEKDKQVARLEAVLADSFNVGGGVLAKLRKGASFTLEQERVNNEIWLPSQADINLSVRVLLVKGIEVNQLVKSYDYRKFETEVKDARVNETKNP